MPARYRGRIFTVWDNDAQRAAETAHEWLDASDKAGIRPDGKRKWSGSATRPSPAI